MDHFNYRNNQLYAEEISLKDIAVKYGTPCYVYSRATLERHWHAFDTAMATIPHLICYAVKANSNLAVLQVLAQLGSGFDIVSIGELDRVLAAGGDPAKVVFSGVGKRSDEIRRALEVGILCFNVESKAELSRLNAIAASMQKIAPVSIRINPDVDAKTHPYIATGLRDNKFGINIDEVEAVYSEARSLTNIDICGIDCHIGSQLTDLEPFIDALDRVLVLLSRLEEMGINIRHLDLGGGLGIPYSATENPPLPQELAKSIVDRLNGISQQIILEPGRAIAGNAGILLTQVEYIKTNQYKNFAIVDAAMNDFARPALYEAWQDIIPVELNTNHPAILYDVVGPVCETGDFLGKQRELNIKQDDLLAIRSAGAYGFVMSSNYNTRCRAAEVMVDGGKAFLIRQRESIADLMRGENLLPASE